jgi:hypothetical protein
MHCGVLRGDLRRHVRATWEGGGLRRVRRHGVLGRGHRPPRRAHPSRASDGGYQLLERFSPGDVVVPLIDVPPVDVSELLGR